MEIQVVVELPTRPVWSYLRDVTKHRWMMDALVSTSRLVTEGLGLTFDCLVAVGRSASGPNGNR